MKTLWMCCVALLFMGLFCSWGCGGEYTAPETAGAAGREVPISNVLVGIGPSSAEDDAAIPLRQESITCSVAQMQNWVLNNYPYSYGWSDTFTGNNGQAYLRGSQCGVGQYNYYEYKWIAYTGTNCTATHCKFDMQDCGGGCNVSGCAHYHYLDCYCGDLNTCQVN